MLESAYPVDDSLLGQVVHTYSDIDHVLHQLQIVSLISLWWVGYDDS